MTSRSEKTYSQRMGKKREGETTAEKSALLTTATEKSVEMFTSDAATVRWSLRISDPSSFGHLVPGAVAVATEECSPIVMQAQAQCQNRVNVDALNQELHLDMLKSREMKDPDPPRSAHQKENMLGSDLTTPIGLTEILDDQLSDLTMVKSQKNLVSES